MAGDIMRRKSLERFWEEEEFKGFYEALAKESKLEEIAQYPQHGSTTRLVHSAAVAYYSYRLAKFTGFTFHWEELVRGALLHDYFFYDAQDGDPAHKWHWTRHPGIAAENAKKELNLTPIEEDTIRSHMFPLTVKPPKYREGVVVSLVDKACSVYEFFSRRAPYRKLRGEMVTYESALSHRIKPGMGILVPKIAGEKAAM